MSVLQSLIQKMFHGNTSNDITHEINYGGFESISEEISYDTILKHYNSKLKLFVSPQDISLANVSFNFSMKETISKLGKPRFKYKKEDQNIHLLFYRTKIIDHKSTMCFAFYKDKFVYGNWTFDRISKSFIKQIEFMIFQKYSIINDSMKDNSLFSDPNNNILEMINLVDYKVNYYTGNQKILEQIKNEQSNHHFIYDVINKHDYKEFEKVI